MKCSIAFASAVFAVAPLAAQQVSVNRQTIPPQLTLEEATAIALRNSPAYLRTQNDAVVALASKRNAFSRMLPVPSGSFSTSGGPSHSISPVSTSSNSSNTGVSFGLRLNVWDGGSTLNQYRASKTQVETGQINLALQEVTVRANVAVQYFQTQQAERAVALEERLLERRKLEQQETNRKYRKALVGMIDDARATESVARAENTVLSARDAVEKAKLSLLQTLGVSANTNFELVTPMPTIAASITLNADSIVRLALEKNPQIRTQQLQLEQQRRNDRVTRNSRFMPSVQINANYSRSVGSSDYGSFFDPEGRQQSANGSLGISFSFSRLLDMPSTSLQLKQSTAGLEDATISLREQLMNIETQVKNAIIDLQQAYRNLAFANETVRNARTRVAVANVRLNNNVMDYFQYQAEIDAESAAEREVLNQQLQVLNRSIALDRLLGVPPRIGAGG